MPKLWSDTIEAHRRDVSAAILDATAGLVAEHGIAAVTMSQVAETAGIGRATLYKYFPDVESILAAWHEGQITRHLQQLVDVRDRAGTAAERLRAVLEAYALMTHHRPPGTDVTAFLHRGAHVAQAQQQLSRFVRNLIADAVRAGDLRTDVPPQELADYCLHALSAAGSVSSKAAVRRLVAVTLAGLRPPG